MPEYVKPPNPAFQTVGVHNLFWIWLKKNYGKHAAKEFREYVERSPNAELWCERCGTVYPLENFGAALDIQWILTPENKIGPMHITFTGHESFINPKALGAVCEESKCKEYNLPLSYLFVGNLRKLALAELETVLLGKSIEEHKDADVWKTTDYLRALGNRSDNAPIEYLLAKGLATEREFRIENSVVKAYKLNEKGKKEFRRVVDLLFDDYSLLDRLDTFVEKRLDKLSVGTKIKSITVKEVAPAGTEDVKEVTTFVAHMPSKLVEHAWKGDHKTFWGAQSR